MVPAAPSSSLESAAAGVEPEASRALLVLRFDGERPVVEPLPVRGALHLATPSGEKEPPGPALVEVRSPVGTLPVANGTGGSFHLPPSRSESITRGAVCVNRARTDLWEPRVGNRPGLPDRFFADIRVNEFPRARGSVRPVDLRIGARAQRRASARVTDAGSR